MGSSYTQQSKGGPDTADNLVLCCRSCSLQKETEASMHGLECTIGYFTKGLSLGNI